MHRARDQRLRPQELLLSRPAQGLSDLPVRPAARDRRQPWTFDSPERGRIRVGITRLHVEEDAGKLLHDRFPGKTAVDLNRAGIPLAEIVSEPDLRSPAEARAYLTTLRQILVYAGVSDCSMEQGSLRVDANLSIRPAGESELGTKTEVKNMNSFANVERALEAERARQVALVEIGQPGRAGRRCSSMREPARSAARSKEESHDYRYFPDPDLPPLVLSPAWIAEQRAALPELPEAKRARLESRLRRSSAYDAEVMTSEAALAHYFESVVARRRRSQGRRQLGHGRCHDHLQ